MSDDTLPFPGSPVVDEGNQRLFIADRTVIAWGPGLRILAFDVDPKRIKTGAPAIAVIGAKDFESCAVGASKNRLSGASMVVDRDNHRLFVSDGGNNRVLVFDIRPDRLRSDSSAVAVIGQPDFTSRAPGIGPNKLSNPRSLAACRT